MQSDSFGTACLIVIFTMARVFCENSYFELNCFLLRF